MQTRTRSGGTRSLQPAAAASPESQSTHTRSSSASNSPSHAMRRSNPPAPLAPDILTNSLPLSLRPDGSASCPVNRTSGPASDVPHMPALSPTSSPSIAPGRHPQSHQRESHQNGSHSGSDGGSSCITSLPPPRTPTQMASASPGEGNESVYRRGHHHSRNSVNSGLDPSTGPQGLRAHEPAPSVLAIPSRLPPVIQPNKLAASVPTSVSVSMGLSSGPPQPPTSTATMPTVPTSPARVVSQPDVTHLTVSSPARRCYLLADSSDQSVESAPAPTMQIPVPPAPSSALRPSSTSGGTSSNHNGTRSSLHNREREPRAVSGNVGTTTDTYLHDNPRVVALVNNLYHHVITAQPEEPLQYLAQLCDGTLPQMPSVPHTTSDMKQKDAMLTPGQQAHTTPQPQQRSSSDHGATHQPHVHTSTGNSTSSPSGSTKMGEDSSGTRGSDRGEAVKGMVQPMAPPRPANCAVSSTAGVTGIVIPLSTAGTITHTNTTCSNVFVSSNASSKRGSPQLLARPGLVTQSLASSGFLTGAMASNTGSQQISGHGSSALHSSGAAAPHTVTSFHGSVSGLERGDATTSDLASMFSTNSIDLHEFISEFRLAKEERYGGGVDHPVITLDELACIIESCSFPCTDAEVLLDLFDELQPCTRCLSGGRSPNGTSPTPSATLKCNNWPPLSRGVLGNGAVNSPSSLNISVFATASANSVIAGKLRAGRGTITNSPGSATISSSNVGGSLWAVQGRESCVAAAQPNASVSARNISHTIRRTADEAEHTGTASVTERADTKDGKLLVRSSHSADARGTYEPSGEGDCYHPCTCCPSGGCKNPSHVQQQQGGMSQHTRSEGASNEDTPTVVFDTLLARMAYKIQGWYSSEAIRIAFYGMVVDEEAAAAAVDGGSRGVGISADGSSSLMNTRGLRRVVSTESLANSEVTVMGSGSAGTGTTGCGTLSSCTVPLCRCITEGLFARLGMVDLTAADLQSGLRSAGLPTSQDEQRIFECQLVHFARLVRAITSASERGCGTTLVSPNPTSLRDIFLQRGSNNSVTLGGN